MDYILFIRNPASTIPIIILVTLILSLWFRSKKISFLLLVLYIAITLISHRMTGLSWIFIAATLGLYSLFYLTKHWIPKTIGLIGFVAGSATILLNKTPGVHNWEILHHYLLAPDSLPWSFFLNYDAPLLGAWVVLLSISLIQSREEWIRVLKQTIPIAIFAILFMIPASYLFGYVRLDPKATNIFFLWGLSNLLFTCLTEEALFRGFIQKTLIGWFSDIPYGQYLGIGIAALCFGLAHFAGGPIYVILATVAGAFYGYAYYSTGRIEASMLTHFLLNTTHFLLFSYPALASSIPH